MSKIARKLLESSSEPGIFHGIVDHHRLVVCDLRNLERMISISGPQEPIFKPNQIQNKSLRECSGTGDQFCGEEAETSLKPSIQHRC